MESAGVDELDVVDVVVVVVVVVDVVDVVVAPPAPPEPPEPPPAPEAPAVITLDIKPMGEVTVDGVMKGKTPPLTELELKAGKHMIVVRNGNHAPLESEINLAPGERVTLTHRFGGGQQRRIERQAQREQSAGDKVNNAVQKMRRKLGI